MTATTCSTVSPPPRSDDRCQPTSREQLCRRPSRARSSRWLSHAHTSDTLPSRASIPAKNVSGLAAPTAATPAAPRSRPRGAARPAARSPCSEQGECAARPEYPRDLRPADRGIDPVERRRREGGGECAVRQLDVLEAADPEGDVGVPPTRRRATSIIRSPGSTASTCSPAPASASVSFPVPQPISSTARPRPTRDRTRGVDDLRRVVGPDAVVLLGDTVEQEARLGRHG